MRMKSSNKSESIGISVPVEQLKKIRSRAHKAGISTSKYFQILAQVDELDDVLPSGMVSKLKKL